MLHGPMNFDAVNSDWLGPQVLWLAHRKSVEIRRREGGIPTHFASLRRGKLDCRPSLVVGNLHRKPSGRAARRGNLNHEILTARKYKAQLVRVIPDDLALPGIGVSRSVVGLRHEVNPTLGDVTAGRDQLRMICFR